MTTSVLWLNDAGLDIRCVRLRVYRHEDELLIDVDQVIPLPEAQKYLVQVRDRVEESQQQRGESGRLVRGAHDFEASIADAPEEHQTNLRKLLDWARSIEKSGNARLFTYHWKGGGGIALRPYLHRIDAGLVTIAQSHGVPSLRLYRIVFERWAEQSIVPLEKALHPERLGSGYATKDFSDEILDLVAKAYEEANAPKVTEQE